jgi:hypothetical protein
MIRRLIYGWDKIVFFSSIAGLLLLIAVSLFRYYYLLPRQEMLSKDAVYINKLELENKLLKDRVLSLEKKIENDQR